MVGLGSAGLRHLVNLRALGCRRLGAVRTRNRPLHQAADLSGVTIHQDYQEALRAGYDAVVIATPTSLHLEQARAAAERGLDIYVEKPVADRLEGTHELARTCEKRGLVAMVGCQLRFHPQLERVHDWLREKRIGRVLDAFADAGEYLPSWHPWEDYREGYAARRDQGGGVVLTVIHEMDYLQWLLGPLSCVAVLGGRSGALEVDAEDHATALLATADGAAVTLHLDYLQRPPSRRLKVLGTKGSIEWDYYAGELQLTVEGNVAETPSLPRDWNRNDLFLGAMRHFLDCVADRKAPKVPLNDGIADLRASLEIRDRITTVVHREVTG